MRERTLAPIPLWKHDQRLAVGIAVAGLALLVISALLAMNAFDQQLAAERWAGATEMSRDKPPASPPGPSSSSPTST